MAAELTFLGKETHMASLEEVAKVFPLVPDPMVLVNGQGVIVLANSHTYSVFGYSDGALTGQRVEQLLPERFRASHGRHLDKYFQTPTARAMGTGLELWARRSDATEFPVEISLGPYRVLDAVYALATIRDISERKRMQAERQESLRQKELLEERARAAQLLADRNEALRAIFQASPLGIVTATREGIIDRWNSAAERIYGYTAEAAIGSSIWELHDEMDAEEDSATAEVRAAVNEGRELRNFLVTQRRKNGKVVDISVSSASFHDANGGNSGFVFLVDDVTARRTIEQQLRQSQKMEAVGQLTGGIAHDFNNLLSIIICNLELLQEKLEPESEDRELSDMALAAGLHGAELVKQILAFSRKQNLDSRRIDVNELVQSMMNLLARSLGEQIEIILELEPRAWPAIADRVQLQTAVVNLATNARDAMQRGGRLMIQTGNTALDENYAQQFAELNAGEYVVVSVTDTGKGMTPETVERAFDPFFTTKPPGEGTGLGLSMVFGFVKQSGGHVRIYSEVGQGTTVCLYLPRANGESSVAMPEQEMQSNPRTKGARILIVEDNLDLAKSANRVLTDAGFVTQEATSADEALAILKSGAKFDLLFTDIILTRGLNGIELAQELREILPDLKVLFSSGFSEAALRVSGKMLVAGNFIAKPYRKDDLVAKVNGLLEGNPVRV
jgi:PAS domain S-box-containing protein